MNYRFNKNEECRCLCIDYIFNYFNVKICDADEVRKANNFVKTILLLKKYNFEVEGYIDKRLLLNVKNIVTILRHKVGIRRSFFREDKAGDYIILYYTSAKELYDLNEMWTHCICETFSENQSSRIFDSYYDVIQEQLKNFEYPQKEQLKNKLIMAIKVWR